MTAPGSRAAAAILVVALVARLGLALLYEPPPLTGDAFDYDQHAATIAATGGYPESRAAVDGGPSAYRPPAFPHLLAAVYELGGRGDGPRVLGALLGTLAVALLGFVASRLFDRRVALVAMAVAAVFPPLVMVSVALLSENLFIVLVLAALACVVRSPERMRWVVAAGVLIGAAVLTRTNGLSLLLPLVLAAAGARRRIALVAAALLVIAPWSVRNSTQFDAFVPLTTQVGITMAGTYNDQARLDDRHPAAWRVPLMAPYAGLRQPGVDEAEFDRAARATALRYALDHPAYPPEVVIRTSARMLELTGFELTVLGAQEAGVGRTFAKLNRFAFWALALLSLAGSFTAAARAAPRWLWLFPVLLWLSVAIITAATRYRAPVDLFLIMLAACALAAASSGLAHRRAS